MSKIAIEVSGLGKQYSLGESQAAYRTLRETIVETLMSPARWLRSRTKQEKHAIWALRDVSFKVNEGESVGIIGANGAGKSSLLKLLSRVTLPTLGTILLRGRVGSILEVGTGFHPELTGRENILLNGAILGMSSREVRNKFDEIVQFSEIEKFVDTPVKFYSSGMYTRLAFSVAAHLEPEILLIDEVLAVGDIGFQKKCLGKMSDVASEGRTILFVSHNMGAILGLCKRVLWIKDGLLFKDANPKEVVDAYVDDSLQGFRPAKARTKGELEIEKIVVKNSTGQTTNQLRSGETFTVEIYYFARRRIETPHFAVGLGLQHGALFAANSLLDGIVPSHIEGAGVIAARFHNVQLLPQIYTLRLGVRDSDAGRALVPTFSASVIKILDRVSDLGLSGQTAESIAWESAPILCHYDWIMPDGKEFSVHPGRRKEEK